MKVQSDLGNDKSSSWGFKKPEDGWHKVEMGEGIDLMKDKEGKVVQDAKGNNLWKFPAKINDGDASDHEADISLVIAETAFGEKKIGDIIAAIGQKDNFEKAFPGDRSFFEQAIMDKVKIKVPGQFCQMRTETSKDGKYSNVVEIATMKFKPVESKAAAPKEAAKGKGKKSEETVADAGAQAKTEDW
ncbi:MAG: hypothetical protein ABFD76_10515 [Smithella sp.]